MTAIPANFGIGGANLQPGLAEPSLANTLRDIADDIGASSAVAPPAWATGIVVTTHVAVLPDAGFVVSVEATAGTAAGPKQIISTATPAAGRVRVEYAPSGIPTLTFNTTDA